MSWLRHARGHWWFMREFGPISAAQYMSVQEERRREEGETFDPARHGERMLRAIGASEEQITRAKAKGFA
jgi:hypothetical protein